VAKGSSTLKMLATLGIRLRQHCLLLKRVFEKELIKTRKTASNAES
jgi:hypothetical protein